MPWSPGPGGGFTTGHPWLRLGPDVDDRNVAHQSTDERSVFSTYRHLIAVRAASAALQVGTLRMHPGSVGEVLAYTREHEGHEVLVIVNMGRRAAGWQLDGSSSDGGWRQLFGTLDGRAVTEDRPGGTWLQLQPDEARILARLDRPAR